MTDTETKLADALRNSTPEQFQRVQRAYEAATK